MCSTFRIFACYRFVVFWAVCLFQLFTFWGFSFAGENGRGSEQPAFSVNETHYTWDNWLTDPMQIRLGEKEFSTIGRFALEAPREVDGRPISPIERHDHARIGFYIRSQPGQWLRLGQAIDLAPSWSGSSFICQKCPDQFFNAPSSPVGTIDSIKNGFSLDFGGHLILAYTERSFSPDPLGQKINIAFFDPVLGSFRKFDQAVLDPQADPDLAKRLGYDIHSNAIIAAWRDPFLVRDAQSRIHMFFAARYNESLYRKKLSKGASGEFNPLRNSAVGHAIYDEASAKWQLQPVQLLPQTQMVQLELPQIIRHKNYYYMMALKADWDVSSEWAAQNELNRHHSLLGYKSASLKGPWLPLGGGDGTISSLESIYGVTFKQIGEKVYMTAFLEDEIHLAQMVEVNLDDFVASVKRGVQKLKKARVLALSCSL